MALRLPSLLRALVAGPLLGGGLAVALVLGARPTQAQADTLVWERVGDVPVKARDLDFGPDGTLYAAGVRAIFALAPGASVWDTLYVHRAGAEYLGGADHLLALSADTLLATRAATWRSTDGGATFTRVYDAGEALFEATDGTLLTGTVNTPPTGVAYSEDRGATWAPAPLDTTTSLLLAAEGFLELPSGRLVESGYNGIAYSDDGGRSWVRSGLWEPFAYTGGPMALATEGRVVATVGGPPIFVSEDDGLTWEEAAVLTEVDGRPTDVELAVSDGPTAEPQAGPLYAVTYFGAVWRSDDAGRTWTRAGVVPLLPPGPGSSRVAEAAVGPDGRLYVAGFRSGTGDEWAYRTVSPVVAAEPEPVPPPEVIGLSAYPNPSRGAATVAFELGAPSRVRLALYDALGREVAVLAGGRFEGGRHEAALDVSHLAPGVYLLRASVEPERGAARTLARRLTLLR